MQRTGRTGRGLALAVSMGALLAAMPAGAQEPAAAPSTPSMLEAMVAGGVITQSQADAILADARRRDAAKAAAAPQAQQGTPAGAVSSKTAAGAVRVQYVPQAVKDQIKAEVKQEVMAKAEAEGWAAPGETPEWAKRIKVYGDVRGRFEASMFPDGNAIGSVDQVDYAALNARSTPLDFNPLNNTSLWQNIPRHNWDEDRTRERIRARLGVEADLEEGFTAGIRLATGDSSSPVSTNQTLGGSGGNFSKYQLWLDRAFIAYDAFDGKAYGLNATVGRFDNPFFGTDLVWDGDLGFDGVALEGTYKVADGVTPFVTIGAFPVFNTGLNVSTYSEEKASSENKWLYGAQAGTDWKVEKDTSVKLAAAYYHFDNIGGRRMDCNYADQSCGSDLFRPTFAQKGNTYMSLRNNIGQPGSPDNYANYQYFGLASGFRELALTGRLDYDGLKPLFPDQALRVSLDGEFVKNLAFDKKRIRDKGAENNLAANTDAFDGGDTGYLARITVGTPKLAKRWDWNASLAYKYVESDAVVDAFADSDFGMGGTNLKGFMLGANLALAKNVSTGFRWMSADSIAGAPYSNDIFLLDLNAKF